MTPSAQIPNATYDMYLPFVISGSGKPPKPKPKPKPKPVLPHFTGMGVGIPHQLVEGCPPSDAEDIYTHIIESLSAQWWYNWKWDQIGKPGYAPMLWRQKWDAHAEAAFVAAENHKHLDLTWLIGNEPMVDGQATATPQEAADLAKRWRRDLPGVKFACPGVYLAFEDRVYQWISDYLDAGGPVPDFWHWHNYAWSGPSAMGMDQGFVAWQRLNNIERPSIISESNIFDDVDWMAQLPMMSYHKFMLENESPIVATCWFAARYGDVWPVRMLMKEGLTERTPLGDKYRQIVDAGVTVRYNGA